MIVLNIDSILKLQFVQQPIKPNSIFIESLTSLDSPVIEFCIWLAFNNTCLELVATIIEYLYFSLLWVRQLVSTATVWVAPQVGLAELRVYRTTADGGDCSRGNRIGKRRQKEDDEDDEM